VLGSLHLDIIVHASDRPRKGETLPGTASSYRAGGKGGNQAVAAAQFGARTSMIGRVGRDDFGERLLSSGCQRHRSGDDLRRGSNEPACGGRSGRSTVKTGRERRCHAGGLGLAVAEGKSSPYVEAAHSVKLVDIHGAGDAFIGALAARWASGTPLREAVRFANAAAALFVSTPADRKKAVTLEQVTRFLSAYR
jgi:sugar/nucleoside kinase (ribokinase family)